MRAAVVSVCILFACTAGATTPRVTKLGPDLAVRELAPSVLLHTTWKVLPDLGRFPSNGLIVLGEHEALLVDTAWTEEATVQLLDHVERAYGRRVTHVIVTHSHDDRTSGVKEALRRGARVHALKLTAARTKAEGRGTPSDTFEQRAVVEFDGVRAEAFFPGAGHAPDNIVVWLPESRTLAGGCMIRSGDSTSLGWLGDASLATWTDSVRAVQRRFPDVAVVVPGHGDPGDVAARAHRRSGEGRPLSRTRRGVIQSTHESRRAAPFASPTRR